MQKNPIYCIMWDGHNLDDNLRTLLFDKAQEMLQTRLQISSVRENWCEGQIETQHKISGFGGTYGYVFNATIEWGSKKSTVEFIVRKTDLDLSGAVWKPMELPVETRVDLGLN